MEKQTWDDIIQEWRGIKMKALQGGQSWKAKKQVNR